MESSNINEVIRTVLNSLYIFLANRFRTHQNHKKHKKAQKAQKRNQSKAQNANERTKIKNVPKKHLRGKK